MQEKTWVEIFSAETGDNGCETAHDFLMLLMLRNSDN